jgi:TPR repeat protein
VAFQSGRFAEATKILKPLADSGNARAQVYLGIMHFNGQGVDESAEQAFAYFMHAAAAGDAEGQFQLAYLYNFGFGIPSDEVNPDGQAVKWYELAAKQGHAEAQYNLGLLYMAGTGVEADQDKGMEWIRRAAKNGNTEAQAFVGN